MLDEVDDAAVVLVRRLRDRVGALVDEADLEALVQERHDLHALDDRLRPELRLLEHGGVRPEGDGGPGPGLAGGPVIRRGSDGGDLLLELAALFELSLPVLAVPVHLQDDAGREGVDDRDPDAMEAPGDLVALAAELAAGMERREHDFGRRLLGVLGVRSDRDPGPVVTDPAAAVGQQGDVDPGGPARHGLVDRVVHDLPDQVVQPGRPGGTDVHTGPLAYRFEPFEDGDVVLGVRRTGLTWSLIHLYCHRRALSEHRSSQCVSNPRNGDFRPLDANAPFYPTAAPIQRL